MNKIFHNVNGKDYYILFGCIGRGAFLCDIEDSETPYVICRRLDEHSWWQGAYFENFNNAILYWNKSNSIDIIEEDEEENDEEEIKVTSWIDSHPDLFEPHCWD